MRKGSIAGYLGPGYLWRVEGWSVSRNRWRGKGKGSCAWMSLPGTGDCGAANDALA